MAVKISITNKYIRSNNIGCPYKLSFKICVSVLFVTAGGATGVAPVLESPKLSAVSATGAANPTASPQRERNAAHAARRLALVATAYAMVQSSAPPTGLLDGLKVKNEA